MTKYIWMVGLLFGCGEESKPSEKGDTSTDTSSAIAENSMDLYKQVYCEAYSKRCNIFPSVEECESDFDSRFSEECFIHDKDLFDQCADWLFSLDCNVTEWNSICEQFYTCP